MRSNIADLIARNRARAVAGKREQSAAARIIAPVLEAESKRILQSEIYGVAIPSSSTGRPKWERLGSKGGIIALEKGVADGVDARLENSSDHAKARYVLGLAGRRQPKSPGVRSVQWQKQTVANKKAFISNERAKAVSRALERP